MLKKVGISKPIYFLVLIIYCANLSKNNLLEEYNFPEDIRNNSLFFSGSLFNKNITPIILQNNHNFYSYLKKDESNSFQIHIPKGDSSTKYERFQITLNISSNDILIDFVNKNNNFDIINKSNDINICYEFIPSIEYYFLPDDFDIDILFNIKANKDIYCFINYNIFPFLYEFEFDKVAKISQINDFPLKISIKLPFKEEKNTNDLLFNFYFNSTDINFEYTKNFDNFDIKVTIINDYSNEQIKENKNFDLNFDTKSTLSSLIDISTHSAAFKINKEFIRKTLNSLDRNNNDEDIYLYISITNKNVTNNITIKNYLDCTLFLIYDDYKNYVINQSKYISSKIIYDEDHEERNYDLYHLQLNNAEDNIFIVDFSSNFALSRGIYVSFIDYDINKKIKDEDGEIYDNSSNIEFIDSNTKKGKTFHFEFKLKNSNIKDIILCIFVKSDELDTYNYIFKYKTLSSEKNRNKINYILNDEVNHSNEDNKTILEIENVQIKNNDKKEYYKGQIYVRKIIKNNKIDREDLDTIATFKSKYELVKGNIEYEKDNKNIKITIPTINKRDHYSILIDIPEINEKFVYNTVNKRKINKPYWAIISIFIFIPLYLVAVVWIIINLANKSINLENEIINTSFKLTEDDEDLKTDKDENSLAE